MSVSKNTVGWNWDLVTGKLLTEQEKQPNESKAEDNTLLKAPLGGLK